MVTNNFFTLVLNTRRLTVMALSFCLIVRQPHLFHIALMVRNEDRNSYVGRSESTYSRTSMARTPLEP